MNYTQWNSRKSHHKYLSLFIVFCEKPTHTSFSIHCWVIDWETIFKDRHRMLSSYDPTATPRLHLVIMFILCDQLHKNVIIYVKTRVIHLDNQWIKWNSIVEVRVHFKQKLYRPKPIWQARGSRSFYGSCLQLHTQAWKPSTTGDTLV